MSDDLVKQPALRRWQESVYGNGPYQVPDYESMAAIVQEHEQMAIRIEELDDIIRADRSRIIELVSMVNSKDDRIEELSNCVAVLEAKLERISEEWAGAVYGDLENGVASLNAAAATDFCKRYPSISAFGDTLMGILLEGEDRG